MRDPSTKMMSENGDCGCGGDSTRSVREMLVAQHCYHREQSGSTNSSARSSRAELREENLWIAQQLAIADAKTRRLQERVRQLRHHAKALQVQHASEREQWRRVMELRQRQWTDEYDRHMQSLLGIIAHHEAKAAVTQREIETLRKEKEEAAAMQRSVSVVREQATQTEEHELEKDDCGGGCRLQHATTTPLDGPPNPPIDCDARNDSSALRDQRLIEEMPSIHEQYAALTMQKLLEQLRLSNKSSGFAGSLEITSSSTSANPSASSFRESVYKRMNSNVSPVTTRSLESQKSASATLHSTMCLQPTLPAICEENGDTQRTRLVPKSSPWRSQSAA